MDYFVGSIKLMFVVYALASAISMGVAFIIKGIFAGIKLRQARHVVRVDYLAEKRPERGHVGQRSGA